MKKNFITKLLTLTLCVLLIAPLYLFACDPVPAQCSMGIKCIYIPLQVYTLPGTENSSNLNIGSFDPQNLTERDYEVTGKWADYIVTGAKGHWFYYDIQFIGDAVAEDENIIIFKNGIRSIDITGKYYKGTKSLSTNYGSIPPSGTIYFDNHPTTQLSNIGCYYIRIQLQSFRILPTAISGNYIIPVQITVNYSDGY